MPPRLQRITTCLCESDSLHAVFIRNQTAHRVLNDQAKGRCRSAVLRFGLSCSRADRGRAWCHGSGSRRVADRVDSLHHRRHSVGDPSRHRPERARRVAVPGHPNRVQREGGPSGPAAGPALPPSYITLILRFSFFIVPGNARRSIAEIVKRGKSSRRVLRSWTRRAVHDLPDAVLKHGRPRECVFQARRREERFNLPGRKLT